jgi:hypothetical protein
VKVDAPLADERRQVRDDAGVDVERIGPVVPPRAEDDAAGDGDDHVDGRPEADRPDVAGIG